MCGCKMTHLLYTCVKTCLFTEKKKGDKGCRLHLIGGTCHSKFWPPEKYHRSPGTKIASGAQLPANNETFSSSLVLVINKIIHTDESSWRSSNNTHSYLLQPLTNELSFCLSCYFEENIWKLQHGPGQIPETRSVKKSCFVFLFLFLSHIIDF